MATKNNLAQILSLGVSYEDATALRRISMTLRRWFEYECGTGEGNVSRSIERDGDEDDSPPFMRVQYPMPGGKYVDQRWPIADKETGARKRMAKILARYPKLSAYVQTDPRGCALYLLRPGDVPEGESASGYYSRGIPVY